jgi:hypothetical protein
MFELDELALPPSHDSRELSAVTVRCLRPLSVQWDHAVALTRAHWLVGLLESE